MPENKAKILLDVPVDDGVLGFENYRDALINIIKSSDPRFTIGIFGGWGTGKTTLMRMMRKRLDDEGEITVWFNPWQFEKERHLMVPLLQTLKFELETKHKDQLKEILRTIGDIAISLTRSLKPEINLGITKIAFDAKELVKEEEEKKDFVSLYFVLNQKLKETIKEIKKDRIVIFIDDLDRCLPDKAMQVLESIKLFLDVEGYVFVIGLDRSIIQKCVNKKYGIESGISGTDYIKKIIQVPFNLPGLREQEVKIYIHQLKGLLKEIRTEEYVEKYIDIISRGMEANPREIKRFINNFILVNQISISETEPDKLLVLLILQLRWEELFEKIAKYKKDFLNKLKFYIDNKKKIDLTDEANYKAFKITCGQYYDFFTNIESYPLYTFLSSKEGKVLFDIIDLDPYIHFSKATVISEAKITSGAYIIESSFSSLLKNGMVKKFNEIRPHPTVDLRGINLSGSIIVGADLRGADLRETILVRADLKRAILSNGFIVSFPLGVPMDPECTEVIWYNTDLSGADLSEANLSEADLDGIIIDDETIFRDTIIQDIKKLSPEIRDTLHIKVEEGVEKATSKRLLIKM
jgi:hypothetical protein